MIGLADFEGDESELRNGIATSFPLVTIWSAGGEPFANFVNSPDNATSNSNWGRQFAGRVPASNGS